MLLHITFFFLTCILQIFHTDFISHNFITLHDSFRTPVDAEWAVIGAGPAGIIAVGILLDLGIPENNILWIDPLFKVGRMGEYYTHVPGNGKINGFISFLHACHTFSQIPSTAKDNLFNFDPNSYQTLSVIVEPLQDITDYLLTKVNNSKGYITQLIFKDSVWKINVNNQHDFNARHVILATGSHPKSLDLENSYNLDVIPLDYAIDPTILPTLVKPYDTIAVFGSAHSAILILKFLSEIPVQKIINFYTRPIVYAIENNIWTINNVYGLKGVAAQWAREVLENNPPHNLERILYNNINIKEYLPLCNKVIYAIGYTHNTFPTIIVDNQELEELPFEKDTGIIGPRLFGIGIAFNALIDTPYGKEPAIGLHGFLKYAQTVMPNWLKRKDKLGFYKQQREILSHYDDLIYICAL